MESFAVQIQQGCGAELQSTYYALKQVYNPRSIHLHQTNHLTSKNTTTFLHLNIDWLNHPSNTYYSVLSILATYLPPDSPITPQQAAERLQATRYPRFSSPRRGDPPQFVRS